MTKKIICIMLCICSFFLTACSNSKQIDKSSLAETITANISGGKTVYTFYILSSEEEVKSVPVEADSLKKACALAKEKYIPNFSLAKFELFVVNEKVGAEAFAEDISFISEEYYFSPVSYVTLCDDNTLKNMEKIKDTPKQIEEHILLLKNKNGDVCINSLSIFNNFADDKKEEFCISYINSQKELKALKKQINKK